jgi:hypothetical protein
VFVIRDGVGGPVGQEPEVVEPHGPAIGLEPECIFLLIGEVGENEIENMKISLI